MRDKENQTEKEELWWEMQALFRKIACSLWKGFSQHSTWWARKKEGFICYTASHAAQNLFLMLLSSLYVWLHICGHPVVLWAYHGHPLLEVSPNAKTRVRQFKVVIAGRSVRACQKWLPQWWVGQKMDELRACEIVHKRSHSLSNLYLTCKEQLISFHLWGQLWFWNRPFR